MGEGVNLKARSSTMQQPDPPAYAQPTRKTAQGRPVLAWAVVCALVLVAVGLGFLVIGAMDEVRQDEERYQRFRQKYEEKPPLAKLPLQGHTDRVRSMCFSADGKRLASASGGYDARENRGWGQVKVWDATTGKETLNLGGHTLWVDSVAFSRDGKRLASASAGGVKVWDAKTGQELLTFRAYDGFVHAACFSPDGKRLATSSGDSKHGEVKVWNADTGQELRSLKGHTGPVWSVCFSPDGKRLASASADKAVKVWDAETGQEAFTLRGHAGFVNSVCFSPGGHRLASASDDKTVKVWDATTGQEILTLDSSAQSIAFSPDGKRLATPSFPTDVRVWDAETGEEVLTLRGHTGEISLLPIVTSVAFSADGKRLAGASWDNEKKRGEVRVWEVPKANVSDAKRTLFLNGVRLLLAIVAAIASITLATCLCVAGKRAWQTIVKRSGSHGPDSSDPSRRSQSSADEASSLMTARPGPYPVPGAGSVLQQGDTRVKAQEKSDLECPRCKVRPVFRELQTGICNLCNQPLEPRAASAPPNNSV
jgi:WD40 repeat protein